MPQFRSPLQDTDLAVMPARVGGGAGASNGPRVGLVRIGFVPRDTDPLVMPDVADDYYYAHHEVRVEANPHTVVTP